ncbi:hypothetical protein EOB36_20515 [Mesorhizobium sp. M6A.T.Cr.TU.017.01.1.1]|uniref:hypothetical protein n=1 Tax=Mesorhizobium sp. M6A.T.Cr.TU.017.01.1.1 TaxID=2496774 RepID=UPI0007ED7CB8|nr:hypothetical protein [Mesorhizobium sp. M6A.T.Cr.TU.017.01.1.1]RUU99463.1 hypothetical protein EOB36_20515 [Mesorhizobium sp. M6A.T.Cr.TU.017.01.1.1]
MTDLSHLNAIEARLYREQVRLAAATNKGERAFREVQVAQAEKELANEHKFLGSVPVAAVAMSDAELLAELLA